MPAIVVVCLTVAACGGEGDRRDADLLVIGAYTAPREAFQRAVIPAFRAEWRRRTGRDVEVRASYLGSGAQARAVSEGFDADVVVLALEGDIDRIAATGLVDAAWRERTGNRGVVARSLVVIAVRSGNPKDIHDFPDLTRPGLEVLTPNPATSGGAMWNVVAVWGAARRAGADRSAATALLGALFENVIVLDKGARESLINFERGIGDAAITYEQEVHVARLAGRRYDYVVPPATVVIDIPAAVVDRHVDRHGTRAVAEAFVAFLRSPDGQRALAAYGFRPAAGGLEVPGDPDFPPPGAPFTVDDLGGWDRVRAELFGPGGVATRAIEGIVQ